MQALPHVSTQISNFKADTLMFDKLTQDFLMTLHHSQHHGGIIVFRIGRVHGWVQQEHPRTFGIVAQSCVMERSPTFAVLLVYFHSRMIQEQFHNGKTAYIKAVFPL